MAELNIKIPQVLEGEVKKIEKEVKELISSEEKSKLLSLFIDEVMKGARQVGQDELVKLGREIKKGRPAQLKAMGLA